MNHLDYELIQLSIVGVFVFVGLCIAMYQQGRRHDRETKALDRMAARFAEGTDSVSGDATRRSEEGEADTAAVLARLHHRAALRRIK